MKIMRSLSISVLGLLLTWNLGCQVDNDSMPKMQQYQYTQLHLGVQVRIVLFAEKKEIANQAASAAFKRIATLEDVFSNYRAHSELNLLTTNAYDKSIKVSDELFFLIKESSAFSQQTGGAFDITLGPYIEIWKASKESKSLPVPIVLENAQKSAGWQNIQIDKERQTISFLAPGMKLDAGGIAKGYILDEALRVLRDQEGPRALIEAGGDIVVGAPPPGRKGWTITIEDAPQSSNIARRAASLSNAAIATSGDTEQFVEIAGKRYSHIIDPRTGLGATTGNLATVIAPNGMTADKFATALTVMKKAEADTLLSAFPEIYTFVRRTPLHE